MSTRAFFGALDDIRRAQQNIAEGIATRRSWQLGGGHEDAARARAVLEEEAPKIHDRAMAWAWQDEKDDEWRIRREMQQTTIVQSDEMLVVVVAVRTLRDEVIRLHECRLPVNLKWFPEQLAKVVDAARAFNGHLARLQLQAAAKPEHKKRRRNAQDALQTTEPSGVPVPGVVT